MRSMTDRRGSRIPSRVAAALLVLLVWLPACKSPGQAAWLGTPASVAPGVDYYKATDESLVEPTGPIAVFLLRLDPQQVRISSALSNDEVMLAERVDAIAKRREAIAAVNAGFFNVRNGEPAGVLKIGGELVSDSGLARGIVAITSPPGARQELAFDQASVRMFLKYTTDAGEVTVPIDGVDTTRERGKLMLYTPSYHDDTDTAPNGTEWVVSGNPLEVVQVLSDAGRTPIPRDGAVLSFGGLEPPEALAALSPGTRISFGTNWHTLNGLADAHLDAAQDVINGAGLLKRNGRALSNWLASENLQPATFTDMRHPRTLIGTDRQGFVWLVVIDGRQPERSVGMTFVELIRLCDRLGLENALNLDGGGSTTMVVKGQIVNRPSDASGPRAVSDAIVVTAR